MGSEACCSRCGVSKPTTEFVKSRREKRGWQQPCKVCSANYAALSRKVDPYHHKALKYKVPKEEIEKQLKKECCDICGFPLKRKCLDHDHSTGELRGVLCDDCNTGLGKFRDNPVILEEAIKYLEKRYGR